MATEVGSLYYDLNIDDKKLKSQLDDADRHVKGFGDKLSQHWDNSVNASKKIAAGLAVAGGAAIAFGVSSVKSFMESEKSVAALENTLKSTNGASGQTIDGLKKMASQLQSTTGYTDEFVMEAQNMLMTFTKVGKDVFPEATRATLDMARQFGGDAQANAIRLGKALQDPIAGVGALAKIGVQFSDVQKEQIANFMEAGDVMSAQKVILGEIATQTKGAADAYGKTFAGQIDILKASFDDLKEGLGELIVNALRPLTKIFADWMKQVNEAGGFMEYFRGIINRNKDMLIIVAGAIVGTLVPAIVSMAVAFGSFLLTIAPWALLGAAAVLIAQKLGISFDDVKNFIGLAVDKIKEWVNWIAQALPWVDIFKTTLGFLGDVFNVVKGIIMGLVDIFMTWFWPSIKAVAAALYENLWPALQQLWEAVVKLWNAINPGFTEALKILGIIIGAIIVAAIWIFINVLNVVIQIFSAVISVISNVIGWIANLISWFGNLVGIVINAVGNIIGWFGRLPGNIGRIVGDVIGWFASIPGRIGSALGGVADAVTAPFRAGFNAIKGVWNNTVGKIGFSIPDWVPGIGGKRFQMPTFAQGGIATGATMGVFGEAGAEAVLPLKFLNRYSDLFDRIERMAAGSPVNSSVRHGDTIVNIGTVEDRQDADYILNRIDINQRLQSRGVAPA